MKPIEMTFKVDTFKLCAAAVCGETIVIMGAAVATAYCASHYAGKEISTIAGMIGWGGTFAVIHRPIWRFVELVHAAVSPE